jgi:hypothetical protein
MTSAKFPGARLLRQSTLRRTAAQLVKREEICGGTSYVERRSSGGIGFRRSHITLTTPGLLGICLRKRLTSRVMKLENLGRTSFQLIEPGDIEVSENG